MGASGEGAAFSPGSSRCLRRQTTTTGEEATLSSGAGDSVSRRLKGKRSLGGESPVLPGASAAALPSTPRRLTRQSSGVEEALLPDSVSQSLKRETAVVVSPHGPAPSTWEPSLKARRVVEVPRFVAAGGPTDEELAAKRVRYRCCCWCFSVFSWCGRGCSAEGAGKEQREGPGGRSFTEHGQPRGRH